MATAARAIEVVVPPEILGPGSEYEVERIKLKQKYGAIIEAAKAVEAIADAEGAEAANNLGRVLQAALKDSEAFFKPIKEQIDALKKPVLAHEKELVGAIESEKKRLGALFSSYNDRIRREREELERKAREEQERIQREEQLLRAVELEELGEAEQAEALLEEPIYAAPVVISAPPKAAGQVAKVTYSAKVTDFKALVRAVADGKVSFSAIVANESYINGLARMEREGFCLPGCELVRAQTVHFRS